MHMANQHHTRGPHENPPEQPGDREGIKVDVKKHPVDVARGAEKEEQRLLEQMDGEAKNVFKKRSDECVALWKDVREQALASAMPTREVAKEDARTLRQRATDTGMPDKELALETFGKADYPPRV